MWKLRLTAAGSRPTIVLVCALILGLMPSGTAAGQGPCEGRVPHRQIFIREEEGPDGFILGHDPVTGSPLYRPGSGVTRGSGTPNDPYVIEGWCLLYAWPPGSPVFLGFPGVDIFGTESHVIIRDNRISGHGWGIFLEDTANVVVEQNDVSDIGDGPASIELVGVRDGIVIRDNLLRGGPSDGIVVRSGSTGVLVESNTVVEHCLELGTCAGIQIRGAHGVVVADNTLRDNGGQGIEINNSSEIAVRANEISGTTYDGIRVGGREAEGNEVHGNLVIGNGMDGIKVFNLAADNTVHHNEILGNGRNGIDLTASFGTSVLNNRIDGNANRGVSFFRTEGTVVQDNEITGNATGIRWGAESFANLLRGNNLDGNQAGLDAAPSEATVDARLNWWGCPGGPSDAACDAAEGDVAYDPWLTEPNPEAGPGETEGGTAATASGETAAAPAETGQAPDKDCGDRDPHPPIVVTGNEGLLGLRIAADPVSGDPIYRPGSGVTAGRGTAEDPYLIEGWCIIGGLHRGGEGADGIWLEGTTDHVVIRNNVVADSRQGIRLSGGVSNAAVTQNTVAANDTHGITLEGSDGNDGIKIADNEVSANGHNGIRLYRSNGIEVRDNRVTGNGQGIVLRGSSDNLVQANTVTDQTQGVVLVPDHDPALPEPERHAPADRNEIRDNMIARNEWVAVYLIGAHENLVEGNTIRETHPENPEDVDDGPAVDISSSREATIRGNLIEDNNAGIRLTIGADNHVTENLIIDSDLFGIYAFRTADLTLSDNMVLAGGGPGIEVEKAPNEQTTTTIEANSVEGHTGDGLSIDGIDGLVVDANTISANGGAGLSVSRASKLQLRRNTILNNGGGLPLSGIGGGSVRNNTVIGNEGPGILMSLAQDLLVWDNHVRGNGSGARIEQAVGPVELRGNNLVDNGVGIDGGGGLDPADATQNWWGCPSGPDDPACDRAVGNLVYDPWLTAANQAAGAT